MANPMTTNDQVQAAAPSEKAVDAGARAAYDRGAVFFTSDAFVPWQELPETTREEWREIVRPILIAASRATPTDPALDPATVEAREIMRIIHKLRSEEGDSVTLYCDNPDFNMGANNALHCHGWWTNFLDRRFEGDTLLSALKAAESAYDIRALASGEERK